MPGGAQALMRTRCPACATIFRVTSEQLRLKAGKVRCGHCQSVFNAFDEFLPDTEVPPVAQPASELAPVFAPPPEAQPEPDPETEPEPPAIAAAVDEALVAPDSDEPPVEALVAEPTEPLPEALVEPEQPAAVEALEVIDPQPPEPVVEEVSALAEPGSETAEESTLAAREAGLVAARELSDAPAYNRWAAGALASDAPGGFAGEPARHAVWPFVLVAGLLLLVLAGQLFYHFRTGLVQRLPAAAALYELAGVDIPLAQNANLVAIETSDLQSDNARGLFVLNATLHNRADFAQAWPALELTLTDTSDTVVSRRVMSAAEYLPPGISAERFPANGEVAVRLWIEARNIGAAGYRLYIFYP
ncbi:DUF3426 domain-containing protein [Dechloromonas denitrificans]|uniref:DUF3426 domain-containing protein n=1 Tax=Dechloromonas denitrificans TaxID=281362 RepID=UPI001CFA6C6F|nr:DUF3426 domain-containing protein [Dechloromonas denitrificans]UCV07738.1 zinc-ribbon domain-containing protein [Dechloromonas denitrificans]